MFIYLFTVFIYLEKKKNGKNLQIRTNVGYRTYVNKSLRKYICPVEKDNS